MGDGVVKTGSVRLPRAGQWVPLPTNELEQVGQLIDPGSQTPEGARGWRATGDARVDFVLIDAPDCWPTLWLVKHDDGTCQPLPEQAAALARHYATGEPLEMPEAQEPVKVHFHMASTGWTEIAPAVLAHVQAIIGHHIKGTEVRGFGVDVPGQPGAVYYLLTGIGPNLPFLCLVAPHLQGKHVVAPREMAQVAEGYALSGAQTPEAIRERLFPRAAKKPVDVPSTPDGETIH